MFWNTIQALLGLYGAWLIYRIVPWDGPWAESRGNASRNT